MTTIRTFLFAALAALFVGFSAPAPATAQALSNTATGQYAGWVQWGGEGRINNVGWNLNANGTLTTAADEHGYWMQVGDYVEFLYFCSGEYLCHYRGRIYNGVISGAATTNQGHTASFEMRIRR
mgnify:CR=1 FL=1